MDADKRMSKQRVLLMAADAYQKANTCDAPDGLQRGIHLEHLDDRDDALGSVGAVASRRVDPTELALPQAVSKGHKCESVSTAMG